MQWNFEAAGGDRFRRGIVCVASVLVFCGCGRSGPDLAPVSGRVTLNGQPVENIKVMFHPDGAKSPSLGRTDKDGEYLLRYKRGVEGGTVGWNVVRLQTVTEVTHGRQQVPEKYVSGSDLRREVKAGKNQFDFELSALDK
jgi:hypothetical protein